MQSPSPLVLARIVVGCGEHLFAGVQRDDAFPDCSPDSCLLGRKQMGAGDMGF